MSKKQATKKEKNKVFDGLFKKGDIVLLVAVLVLVVLTIVFALKADASEADVYVDGKLVYKLDLNKNATVEILDGKMQIKVENGKVFVAQSDCKNQLCVHAQPIGKEGGVIVCLPNKAVVKVVAKEVDAIT